jgi:carbamoyltransferase
VPVPETAEKLWGIDQLNVPRSTIPAVTHVDYSARIQTVRRETNPLYYDVIDAFYRRTGCPVVVNTSFNVRGEPIVCTPEDAYRCFMRTDMDVLVLENFVLLKRDQAPMASDESWKTEFVLD